MRSLKSLPRPRLHNVIFAMVYFYIELTNSKLCFITCRLWLDIVFTISLKGNVLLNEALLYAVCSFNLYLQNRSETPIKLRMYFIQDERNMYRLFNVLCWLWNIYEGAEFLSVYFITNTKHCITYLALTQLFPVLVSHPEMYTLCSILLHFV